MVTIAHTRVKTTGDAIRNYISYFQSVTTIGIINRARTAKEAETKARSKLSRSDFMCGVLGQTPFEPYATEEWKPEAAAVIMPPQNDTDDLEGSLRLDINDDIRSKIALKMKKSVEELTDNDCVEFVRSSLSSSLS